LRTPVNSRNVKIGNQQRQNGRRDVSKSNKIRAKAGKPEFENVIQIKKSEYNKKYNVHHVNKQKN